MSSESAMNCVFTFTWKIENYFSCWEIKAGEKILSPMFFPEKLKERKWFLELYPMTSSGFIHCRLCTLSATVKARICCNIEIIDAFGEVLVCEPMQMHSLQRCGNVNYYELAKYFPHPENRKYLPEDSITIRCNLVTDKTKKIPECAALTKIGVDRSSFKLSVNILKASILKVGMCFIFSDLFQFEIHVYSREDDFQINIFRVNGERLPPCFLICKISLLDLDGVESISRCDSSLFSNQNWQFASFLKKSMLTREASKYLSNNSFTLFCDFWLPNGTRLTQIKCINDQYSVPVDSSSRMNLVKVVDTASSVIPDKVVDPVSSANSVRVVDSVSSAKSVKVVDSALLDDSLKVLRDDFRNLFISHENSDVRLRADNKTFPAHKAVLSARSPVFRAMFCQDMLENQTGIVNISDIDAKSLNYLLGFIYTGTMDRLGYESGLKLLLAADKYQVHSLKEECSSFLKSILCVENVCEIIVVADMVGHELLKLSAVGYIKAHASKILPTAEWKQCLKENVELATEILCKLSVDFERNN